MREMGCKGQCEGKAFCAGPFCSGRVLSPEALSMKKKEVSLVSGNGAVSFLLGPPALLGPSSS